MEGKAVHPFLEVITILEYVPAGYELDDEGPANRSEEDIDGIPEFVEEKIVEDETMRWDEDEDEDKDKDKEDYEDEV